MQVEVLVGDYPFNKGNELKPNQKWLNRQTWSVKENFNVSFVDELTISINVSRNDIFQLIRIKQEDNTYKYYYLGTKYDNNKKVIRCTFVLDIWLTYGIGRWTYLNTTRNIRTDGAPKPSPFYNETLVPSTKISYEFLEKPYHYNTRSISVHPDDLDRIDYEEHTHLYMLFYQQLNNKYFLVPNFPKDITLIIPRADEGEVMTTPCYNGALLESKDGYSFLESGVLESADTNRLGKFVGMYVLPHWSTLPYYRGTTIKLMTSQQADKAWEIIKDKAGYNKFFTKEWMQNNLVDRDGWYFELNNGFMNIFLQDILEDHKEFANVEIDYLGINNYNDLYQVKYLHYDVNGGFKLVSDYKVIPLETRLPITISSVSKEFVEQQNSFNTGLAIAKDNKKAAHISNIVGMIGKGLPNPLNFLAGKPGAGGIAGMVSQGAGAVAEGVIEAWNIDRQFKNSRAEINSKWLDKRAADTGYVNTYDSPSLQKFASLPFTHNDDKQKEVLTYFGDKTVAKKLFKFYGFSCSIIPVELAEENNYLQVDEQELIVQNYEGMSPVEIDALKTLLINGIRLTDGTEGF